MRLIFLLLLFFTSILSYSCGCPLQSCFTGTRLWIFPKNQKFNDGVYQVSITYEDERASHTYLCVFSVRKSLIYMQKVCSEGGSDFQWDISNTAPNSLSSKLFVLFYLETIFPKKIAFTVRQKETLLAKFHSTSMQYTTESPNAIFCDACKYGEARLSL